MADQDYLGFQVAAQKRRSASGWRGVLSSIVLFIARDAKLFFRPARIPVIAHALAASILFVSIGAIAVLFEVAADMMTRSDMPHGFGTSFRYLALLLTYFGVVAAVMLVVAGIVRQTQDLRRMIRG
ncbi:hypothetical protein RPMA_09095 [Tardiphaga alba]|uniref:Uncharacterized protein n=1 Tax=Tardiphaga alba TaxID=340268 RepID=A0ABX8A5F8_9BRAD|nr:hypothetical protein [Tardiphaga alba]QUS38963.1 hypothetical protein RPMA_09095 [Tardiphaga alba]